VRWVNEGKGQALRASETEKALQPAGRAWREWAGGGNLATQALVPTRGLRFGNKSAPGFHCLRFLV
jgi:hypothetical protein